ncbi:hypothetical protein [Cohnella zeiphila]|uniref:Uncharacterized protein n=1 Tax=Cohnella zeiphila TaxID=2761120 RepID=A0A7X0SG95_9BACL|nr:hypothetical protein [Cohnella zeiphila]MBB6729418.1 hypothetical protein [Cohnella zeiphila]
MNVPWRPAGTTAGVVLLFAALVLCVPSNEKPAGRSGSPDAAKPLFSDTVIPLSIGGNAPPADAGKHPVDAAAASRDERDSPSDVAFDSRNPTLAGLALGMKQSEVDKRLGSSASEYDLPTAGGTVHMAEYDVATVGFGPGSSVVYVEVSKPGADSGLLDIGVGQRGKQAAGTLGLPFASETRVLSEPVEGGLLKIDLEPAAQMVVSIKLIGEFNP